MKMYLLTAAVLAALASQVVMAASEGGDTWSEIQPAQYSAYSPLQSVQRTDPLDPDLEASFEGSEGGDTWSSVQALRDTTAQPAAVRDHPDRADTKYAGQFGGSEGGDTWSRFVPQFRSQAVGSADMASTRDDTRDHWQAPFGE